MPGRQWWEVASHKYYHWKVGRLFEGDREGAELGRDRQARGRVGLGVGQTWADSAPL